MHLLSLRLNEPSYHGHSLTPILVGSSPDNHSRRLSRDLGLWGTLCEPASVFKGHLTVPYHLYVACGCAGHSTESIVQQR